MFDFFSSDFLLMSLGRIPAILFALTFHEAAHAWMALRCGDDTAARMGRITLNPVAHLDPVGSIGLLIGFFGWGKPVPVQERNFHNPLRDTMYVAAAGPVSNLLLAAISGLLFRFFLIIHDHGWVGDSVTGERLILFLIFLSAWSILINLCLCFFNLIPVFPLDGEKILLGLLPYRQAYSYAQFRQYGPMGLLLLIILGAPFISLWIGLLSAPFSYIFSGLSFNGIYQTIQLVFHALW